MKKKYQYMKNKSKMKRSYPANNTRSKKNKIFYQMDFGLPWVSASKTTNYMLNDPIIDVLEKNIKKEYTNKFQEHLKRKGIEFEKKAVEYIDTNILQVFDVLKDGEYSEAIIKKKSKDTAHLMRMGFPVLHSAPLYHKYTNTGGIADLLVRSDHVEKIFKVCPLTELEKKIPSPKLQTAYHYIVIDIKLSRLKLLSDGKTLCNNIKYEKYRSQTYIYNKILGYIQGYTPRKTFILGNGFMCNNVLGNSCLERVGSINFDDSNKKIRRSINHCRMVNTLPYMDELYPNMKNDNDKWYKEKFELAEKRGETTLLWNCGVKNREMALRNNITDFKDDRCVSSLLGINGKRSKILDRILEVNYTKNSHLVLPLKMEPKFWQTLDPNELYVDFEIFTDIFDTFENFPERTPLEYEIFMIGVGYIENNKYIYTNFICKERTKKEEDRIMDEFNKFVMDRGNPPIYFWYADKNFWERRYTGTQYNWVDMHKIFTDEPIGIKGCYNYKLKSIASKLYEYRKIKTKLDSECTSGMTAMIDAWNCYENDQNPLESFTMQDIVKYNQFDCRVMYDILTYLRNNHF